MSGSRTTTLVAGLAVVGTVLLDPAVLRGIRIQPTPDIESTLVLQGPLVDLAQVLLVLVAAVVLACGMRGEPGLLRASRAAGAAALVAAVATAAVAGWRTLVAPSASADGIVPPGVAALSTALDAVQGTAVVVLALLVFRRRLLEPPARVPLLVLGLSWGAYLLLVPVIGMLAAGDGGSSLILPLLVFPGLVVAASAALGVGLLVHGRSAAMRARAERIRRAW
ncbi:hypothetical protein [Clavibacter sp. B3I6]|uniref:hypothetical protein n=1 Tax=Clavibacter sp. B3I6 TaxID=3042268 RepID=UPI0027D8D530|nr:hypothetical protein [Clavibacter sp. B3I6]